MEKTVKPRDAGVELARILGCFIIIGCHSYLPFSPDGSDGLGRLFIGTLFADGVSVFWLILGFFLFQEKDYHKLCRRTLSRIILPLFAFSIFSFFFLPYVRGSVPSLAACFLRPKKDYIDAAKALMGWWPLPTAGHLWFLYIYILLIAIFPALSGMVNYLEKNSRARMWYLIGSAVIFANNVILDNEMMSFSHYTIGGLVPASMIAIFGHFLYQRRDKMVRFGWLAPAVFVCMNGIRTLLCSRGFETILYWYSVSGVIGACCVIAFCMSAMHHVKSKRVETLVLKTASYTFAIYLVHHFSISLLRRWHVNKLLLDRVSILPTFFAELVYTVAFSLLVFGMSLGFAICNRWIGQKIRRERKVES